MLWFRRPEQTSLDNSGLSSIVLCYTTGEVVEPLAANPIISFHMETYTTIKKNKTRISGDSILYYINEFLALFNAEEQLLIYNFYSEAKNITDKLKFNQNIVRTVIDELTTRSTNLMAQLQFCQKAILLSEQNVILLNLDYVGVAAHYTNEYSFYKNDYYQLIAISLLCKFMCPIWGEFIYLVMHADKSPGKNSVLIDERNNKELFCATMLLPTLENGPLSFIYHKLHKYLINIVKRAIKQVQTTSSTTQPPIDFVMAKYGYDTRRFEDYVYSVLLVKRIVGFDSRQVNTDGDMANIGRLVNVVINDTANTQLKKMRHETRMMPRNEIPDGGNEQDNISFTDNLSRISSMSADIPSVVVFGVNLEIPRLLAKNDISVEQYESALAYYRYKRCSPSLFNLAILASLHARWIGGASLIRLLDADTYVKLLTYTQLYLIKHQWYQLAMFLTCLTLPDELESIRPEGHRIRNNIKTTVEYREVDRLFPGSAEKQIVPYGIPVGVRVTKRELVEVINIIGQIDRIQNWVIDYNHIAQVASTILDELPDEWKNRVIQDELLVYDEKIIREVCMFFLTYHGKPT